MSVSNGRACLSLITWLFACVTLAASVARLHKATGAAGLIADHVTFAQAAKFMFDGAHAPAVRAINDSAARPSERLLYCRGPAAVWRSHNLTLAGHG